MHAETMSYAGFEEEGVLGWRLRPHKLCPVWRKMLQAGQAGGMNHGRKTSPHIDGGETTGVNPTGSPRLLDNEGSVLPRGLSHLIDGL
jgi:hypothetical protein